jgi:hypothetical protein
MAKQVGDDVWVIEHLPINPSISYVPVGVRYASRWILNAHKFFSGDLVWELYETVFNVVVGACDQ